MKTLNKTLLTIGVLLSLCASVRAQSFAFGLSTGYGGLNSIGFSYGYGGVGFGVGISSGAYYAPYCGYSYPYYGYPYNYGYPYYNYGYYGYNPTYYATCYAPVYSSCSPWTPVYAAPVYYPWYSCNTWWGYGGCGWNNCWNSGWYNTGWYNNGCWNGNWHGSGWAPTHPGGSGPILPPPTVGLQQAGRMDPGARGNAATVAGGPSGMRPPGAASGRLGAGNGRAVAGAGVMGAGNMRSGAAATGQIAGTPASGYRTIHSLAWNNASRAASSPQMGSASGQMSQFPLKNVSPVNGAVVYQPVRSTGWNASSANYSVPRSTAYQPVRTSPGWNGANRAVMPSNGGVRYQQAPTLGWKGANQAVRAPAQNGGARGFTSAPSAGSFRPSGGSSGGGYRPSSGGSSNGGSSGFSSRSFGGNMGSFGGGSFHR